MNRRTFLKQLPIVSALPFLPNLLELPETEQVLTEREMGLNFKVLDEAARAYEAKAPVLGSALSRLEPGGVEFIAQNLSGYFKALRIEDNFNAIDHAKRMERSMERLIERNRLR